MPASAATSRSVMPGVLASEMRTRAWLVTKVHAGGTNRTYPHGSPAYLVLRPSARPARLVPRRRLCPVSASVCRAVASDRTVWSRVGGELTPRLGVDRVV